MVKISEPKKPFVCVEILKKRKFKICINLQLLFKFEEAFNQSYKSFYMLKKAYTMDELYWIGQTQGRVLNSRNGCMHAMHYFCYEAKLPNLDLKTRHKQLGRV